MVLELEGPTGMSLEIAAGFPEALSEMSQRYTDLETTPSSEIFLLSLLAKSYDAPRTMFLEARARSKARHIISSYLIKERLTLFHNPKNVIHLENYLARFLYQGKNKTYGELDGLFATHDIPPAVRAQAEHILTIYRKQGNRLSRSCQEIVEELFRQMEMKKLDGSNFYKTVI